MESATTDSTTYDERFLISVSENMPSLEECTNFVNDPTCGAISTFVGITRDNFQGKRVLKLSYEGYVPMAEKQLRILCMDAISPNNYPTVKKIAAVHVLGDCPVGHASVILAVSSPHRTEAIHCCEYLINELKARIPIWKLETYEEVSPNGETGTTTTSSVWKENIEWKQGKQQRVMKKVEQEETTTTTTT